MACNVLKTKISHRNFWFILQMLGIRWYSRPWENRRFSKLRAGHSDREFDVEKGVPFYMFQKASIKQIGGRGPGPGPSADSAGTRERNVGHFGFLYSNSNFWSNPPTAAQKFSKVYLIFQQYHKIKWYYFDSGQMWQQITWACARTVVCSLLMLKQITVQRSAGNQKIQLENGCSRFYILYILVCQAVCVISVMSCVHVTTWRVTCVMTFTYVYVLQRSTASIDPRCTTHAWPLAKT